MKLKFHAIYLKVNEIINWLKRLRLIAGDEKLLTKRAGECILPGACPSPCTCNGATVDCSDKKLTSIPRELPIYTSTLLLGNNDIEKIKAENLFEKLPELQHLDLRRNKITRIEATAFKGAHKLTELLLSDNKLREVHNKMFNGLVNLKTLNLTANAITCVMPGSFEGLVHLRNINMQENPLSCNCHLAWFAEWLTTHEMPGIIGRCHDPPRLKDAHVKDIPRHEFKCNSDSVGCLGDDYCPPRCQCAGSVVSCLRSHLTEIPRGIPPETTELLLGVNDIKTIQPERLNHLRMLTRLDLSNNQIGMLSNDTFRNLTKLSHLIISYNKLQCVQRNALAGLKSLRIINLHGNDISTIPEGAFDDLESITHLALGANPLYCDCHMRWLAEWVKKNVDVEPGIARCMEPPAMKEKLLLTAPANAFQCKTKQQPAEVMAKCDVCYTIPCQNGGLCKTLPDRQFNCKCTPGYHGDRCQYKIDACYGNPCRNAGTCKVLEEGRFSCDCAAGYEGLRCENNVNDCANNRCANNSTCVDLIQAYRCDCSPGFMGEYCETKIPFCTKGHDPCENGGRCVDHRTHYSCECPIGFSGLNCSTNLDDCIDHLCQNGATCIDGINNYECKCPADYTGRYCEAAPSPAMLYPQTSPCAHHDCQHGACFQPSSDSAAGYLCQCHPGYTANGSAITHNPFVQRENKQIQTDENDTNQTGEQLNKLDVTLNSSDYFSHRTSSNFLANPLARDNLIDVTVNQTRISTDNLNGHLTATGQFGIYTQVVNIPCENITRITSLSDNNSNKRRKKFIEIIEGSNQTIKNINDKLLAIIRAMTPTWSIRLLGVSCGSVICAWGLLLVLSVLGGASHSTGVGSYGFDNVGNMEDLNNARCPWACSCEGQELDCSERGLTQVPGDLAVLAEK
ncbi:hypothetical protein PV327_001742, partial [Microctonus hyperodae]